MNLLSNIRWPRAFAGLRRIKLADMPREVSAGELGRSLHRHATFRDSIIEDAIRRM